MTDNALPTMYFQPISWLSSFSELLLSLIAGHSDDQIRFSQYSPEHRKRKSQIALCISSALNICEDPRMVYRYCLTTHDTFADDSERFVAEVLTSLW